MKRSICTIALLALLGATALSGTAQPDRAPDRALDSALAPAPNQDPAEFLSRRIDSLDAERARLNEALTRLESGDDWDDIRRDAFREARRTGADRRSRPARRDRIFDEAATLESLTTVDPEAAERFASLRKKNPRVAMRLLRSSAPKLHKLEQLREKDPVRYEIEAEQFRIDRQIMHLAWSMHAAIAGNAEADAQPLDNVRAELRELVSQQVDLQIEAQKLQLDSARDRIGHLSDKIAERVASRDAVITDRVDRIMERAVRSGADRRQRGDGPRQHDSPQHPEQH